MIFENSQIREIINKNLSVYFGNYAKLGQVRDELDREVRDELDRGDEPDKVEFGYLRSGQATAGGQVLGSTSWIGQVRDELDRVGQRRAGKGQVQGQVIYRKVGFGWALI